MITGGTLTNGNTITEQMQQQHLQPQQQPQQQQLTVAPDAPALLNLGREQQCAAVQLSHYVYTLLCIISQLMTTNERYVVVDGNNEHLNEVLCCSLQAQIVTLRGGADGSKQYRHNQQLEELRNLQDKLSAEKAAFAVARDQEAKELEEKRQELLRLQVNIFLYTGDDL